MNKKLRKRHFAEFLILADKMEKRGWSLKKFIQYMCLVNEKSEEEIRILTEKL